MLHILIKMERSIQQRLAIINVDEDDTVISACTKLSHQLGMPEAAPLSLWHDNIMLPATLRLADLANAIQLSPSTSPASLPVLTLTCSNGCPSETTATTDQQHPVLQLFINVMAGKTITLQLTPETNIAALKRMVELRTRLPRERQSLLFLGRPLRDHMSLSDYNIHTESTIDMVLPLCGGAPKKCFIPDCIGRAAKIVGDCRYCENSFCGHHRLPESHGCQNLQSCRQQSYEKNSDKLLREKCVADKV